MKDATQAEWEQQNLFIDPQIRAKSAKWILTHQTVNGSWKESAHTLDREKFQVRYLNRFVQCLDVERTMDVFVGHTKCFTVESVIDSSSDNCVKYEFGCKWVH